MQLAIGSGGPCDPAQSRGISCGRTASRWFWRVDRNHPPYYSTRHVTRGG